MTRLKRKKVLPKVAAEDVRFGTPQEVAKYRAQRLATLKPETIIEVGAGAGFQTSAFAKVAQYVIAVDIDKERLDRADLPQNVTTIVGDALDDETIKKLRALVKGKTVIFLDPERPPSAQERRLQDIKPDIKEFIKRYSTISPDIVIELPPFLTEIPEGFEREYLSIDGALNRLTIYGGALKTCDISVVKLPEGNRLEYSGESPQSRSERVKHIFLLEPDAALAHAKLATIALNTHYEEETLGKKTIYFTDKRSTSPFFKQYRIVAEGRKHIEHTIPKVDCGAVILHGPMDQDEQRSLLYNLNKLCRGSQRLHLFLGNDWYLAKRD